METAIEKLYDVADDYEKDVLDSLRLRSNLIWQCEVCHWFNDPLADKCENCGTLKPLAAIDQAS
jgi:hypothetical protein